MVFNPLAGRFVYPENLVVLEIVDSTTKDRIEGAIVTMVGSNLQRNTGRNTDSCGKVSWRLRAGMYRFLISKEGYNSREVGFSINESRSLLVELIKSLKVTVAK
jgi:uncharacterized surface anchored protein